MSNRGSRMMQVVTGMMVLGALSSVPAAAADAVVSNPNTTPRRIIVSIPARRLVVVENNQVLATFAVPSTLRRPRALWVRSR